MKLNGNGMKAKKGLNCHRNIAKIGKVSLVPIFETPEQEKIFAESAIKSSNSKRSLIAAKKP